MPEPSNDPPRQAPRHAPSAKRYRAVSRMTWPKDPDLFKRRLAGENCPVPADGWEGVDSGEMIPEHIAKLPAMAKYLRQGSIEEVE